MEFSEAPEAGEIVGLLGSARVTISAFSSSSQFLSYQDKRINHGNLPHLQQRVRFAASDPSQYDASINLMNLQVSDTATYECRVKKTTMASRKVIVTVQGTAGRLRAPLPQTAAPLAGAPAHTCPVLRSATRGAHVLV